MAHLGEVVAHPAGLRVTLIEAASQTNGNRLHLDVVMPRRFSVAQHYRRLTEGAQAVKPAGSGDSNGGVRE